MIEVKCRGCGGKFTHRHLHDTAHGLEETHMAGTERFECSNCGCLTFVTDADFASDFPFTLDVGRKEGTPQ